MHGRMQPIPAFISPACAELIKKALSCHAKTRITLDELAGSAWVKKQAEEFQQQLSSGTAAGAHPQGHSVHDRRADFDAQCLQREAAMWNGRQDLGGRQMAAEVAGKASCCTWRKSGS